MAIRGRKNPFRFPAETLEHFLEGRPPCDLVVPLLILKGEKSTKWMTNNQSHMGVSENSGFSPPNHPIKNRGFHYFHHPIWGKIPYFWKHPYSECDSSLFVLFNQKFPGSAFCQSLKLWRWSHSWQTSIFLRISRQSFTAHPLKINHPKKERIVFQPSIFQGRTVKLWGCINYDYSYRLEISTSLS